MGGIWVLTRQYDVGAFSVWLAALLFFGLIIERIRNRKIFRTFIKERADLEDERDKLNKRIQQASHEAGKAEFVTGVLHNVGNILTTLNVTSELIEEKLHRLNVEGVSKLQSLFQKDLNATEMVLLKDQRGKLIPEYLGRLDKLLLGQKEELVSTIHSLNKSIDHLKQIVSSQQRSAKLGGRIETTLIEEIINDSLHLTSPLFSLGGVNSETHLKFEGAILTDRSKVVMILVNLIRNALSAIRQHSPNDPRLTLSVEKNDEGGVDFIVTDNGVGISPDHLVEIFNYGFTTKEDGHGFGLHSCVIAAQQMGGVLRAKSDGLGRGATLCLSLPESCLNKESSLIC